MTTFTQRFDKDTTTDEVLDGVDLTGRRIVVTGASGGLGEESARAFAAHGATVTMLARDPARNAAAADRIRAGAPDARLELGTVDLASLASIRAFAAGFLADHDAIDVLVNNAGVMASPLTRTEDGFELQFGTNHLGHFLLTALLLPALLAGDRPRVVNLTSAGHAISDVDLDDWNFERTDYHPWAAYGRSKTANVLFAKELARRYGDRGLRAFAVHPGTIQTDLDRHMEAGSLAAMLGRNREKLLAAGQPTDGTEFKSIPVGTATQVWAATAPELDDRNGAYLGDCQLGDPDAPVGGHGYLPHVEDAAKAEALWELSERLVSQTAPA
jgi:NAD(P)-dependent dehydrogenase (short-subunit alcohol dehydrogenase family)